VAGLGIDALTGLHLSTHYHGHRLRPRKRVSMKQWREYLQFYYARPRTDSLQGQV
jgi:hypothetical protein